MKKKVRFYGYHGAIQKVEHEHETKKTEKRREATSHVVAMCCLCALNRDFGLGEARLRRVSDIAGAVADQFGLNNKSVGWIKAKKKLEEDIAEVFTGDFILPVIVTPKKQQDWARLSEQRGVADTVVKFYIKAVREVMGFGKDRTAVFVRAVEREYRSFADWAKDGDYYGYYRLAQKMSTILRTELIVDESGVSEPLFGETLY